jgi:hypothetical protein
MKIKTMKVKELIELLQKQEQEKEIRFRYFYRGQDSDIFHTNGDIEEILDKVYITIKR